MIINLDKAECDYFSGSPECKYRCANCNDFVLDDDYSFCPYCGEAIEWRDSSET